MNGLIPALIAVLLAEIGPRAAVHAGSHWRVAVLCAGVIGAAVAGTFVASSLTGWANAFLIAISLGLAALGQAQRVPPTITTMTAIIIFWRGGVPLIAFAFATRFGAVWVGAGALMGLLAASVLTRALHGGNISIAPFRWGAVAILGMAAMTVAIGALRLA